MKHVPQYHFEDKLKLGMAQLISSNSDQVNRT